MPPNSAPINPGDRPPIQQFFIAATELMRVLTEAAEEMLEEFREDRDSK